MIRDIQRLQKQTKEQKPFVHCITNPISIHDCANVVLAAGGHPIMAEHPGEVAEITGTADVLMLNLGNITDARMESMKLSLKTANDKNIPVLLDLVGVACSTMRREYAEELLATGQMSILKGNMSEILAIAGEVSHSIGTDAGGEDALTLENRGRVMRIFRDFSRKTGAVILASGKEDLIIDEERAFLAENGDEMLSEVTGTGCMLGALTATYLAAQKRTPFCAALLGVSAMGIAGEMAAENCPGTGTFQTRLLDCLYRIDEEILERKAKFGRLQ